MKKTYYLFILAIALCCFTACNSDDNKLNIDNKEKIATLLQNMKQYGTKSTIVTTKNNANKWQRPDDWFDEDQWHPNLNDNKETVSEWPENWEDKYMGNDNNSFEKAYFFIRLDGDAITDHGLINPQLYYPQTPNGDSYYGELNKGVIETNLKNTKIEPAKWNYYNESVNKYIYSSNGSASNEIIVETPDITRWSIDGEPIDTTKYHVIWYIVKLQPDGWHVDGILTTKDVTELPDDTQKENEDLEDTKIDPTEDDDKDDKDDDNNEGNNDNVKLEGEVEFDIHQQEHQNWNEIKTTVHLRDTANVRIFIPIEGQYIAVADDFDIRVGNTWGEIEEKIEIVETEYTIAGQTFTTNVYVSHKENGIEILIEGSTCAEALKLARKHYDDGITFEIHNYIYSSITSETVWAWLKETECAQTSVADWPKSGDCCTHTYGQVSSAYYPAEKIEYDKNPE